MNQSELRSILEDIRAVYGVPEWELYWEDTAAFEEFQEQIERLSHAAAFTTEDATSKHLFLGRVQELYQKMIQAHGNEGWFDFFCHNGNELIRVLHERVATDQPWILDALARSSDFVEEIDEEASFSELPLEAIVKFAPVFQFIAIIDLLSSDEECEEELAD